MGRTVWTKRIKFDSQSQVVIVELVKFLPLVSKREEAALKASLSAAIKEDWGIRPQILLLGRLGGDSDAQYWIRQVTIDLSD